MTGRDWQKSSFSGEGDACIHLAAARADTVYLYESDAPETVLTTTSGRLRHFIAGIKAGSFNR
ncbi:DUF397 domain-containing protein [Streptomyces sp. NPDC051162]|uniref:DUF397 domain-containing protein n=1 Tax=unclassified Streptomyces TaxID=2593676 RepID=UPI0034176C68